MSNEPNNIQRQLQEANERLLKRRRRMHLEKQGQPVHVREIIGTVVEEMEREADHVVKTRR